MTQHQSDVLKVAIDLVKKGAIVTIDNKIFGFEIKLIPLGNGKFKAML